MTRLFASSAPFVGRSLTEYLADREGLSGTPRRVFLELLINAFHYDRGARPIDWKWWAAAALALGGLGTLFERLSSASTLPDGWWAVWPVCGGLGAALACFRRSQPRKDDPESQWRVYCWLVRPVILAEKPGLLDRNLAADRGQFDRIRLSPASALRHAASEDLGTAALIGLWVGMIAAATLRLVVDAPGWGLAALPVVGALAGPIVRSFGQWLAYRWVMRDRKQRGYMGPAADR
jgi:hypothetical protein